MGVLLGNGDGTFQPAVNDAAGGYLSNSVAVADMNGDGKPDLVVASLCSITTNSQCNDHLVNGVVSVMLGNGDGTFQTAVTYDSGGIWLASVAAADVNGDGKPDIVLTNCSTGKDCVSGNGTVAVRLGIGDGTVRAAVTYDSGGLDASSVAVAEVNGDGKLDLVAANGCASANDCSTASVGVLLGNGDGTFRTAMTYGSGGFGPRSVATADVNGDGNLDLVVAHQCASAGNCTNGIVTVLLGNGDGAFQTPVAFGSGGSDASSVAAADVNGDGKPDLMVTKEQSKSVSVLFNTTISTTTTALVSSLNPSNFGQTVSLTATLTAQPGFFKGAPAGTVAFFDSATATNLGTFPLGSSGVVNLQLSNLGPSTHAITATYSGDANFASSISPALRQVVLGAAAKFPPTSLDFGNQTVATSTSPQSFTLNNTGDIPLTFASITITGTNAADFTQTNTCGSSLAGGASCTFSVIFKPSAAGSRSAAVTLSDNAPSKVQKVQLKGVGVLPVVTLAPPSLTFPTQIVDTTSKAQTVTLTNSGLGILNISKIASAGPFSQTNNCGSTISPAGSCTLTVTFRPTTLGALAGSISITDNAPGNPQKVPLTGTATAVQLTPASVSFGNQPVGTTSLANTITLSNKSHATVNITGTTITGVNASNFTETNTCGTSVASGASCFIKVKFTPSATGKRAAALSVTDDGGGSPQKVGLAGTGT